MKPHRDIATSRQYRIDDKTIVTFWFDDGEHVVRIWETWQDAGSPNNFGGHNDYTMTIIFVSDYDEDLDRAPIYHTNECVVILPNKTYEMLQEMRK